ncbi:glycosyltransferase [Geodermatophilus sabuli]|uniref:Glycosyltransferase involved in cell wall bisynthesis n=1 Tax=Geodermatophilus sabuli TaxID=1564158 RepID=A0A285EF46_9ACTN|nr:glycosyltransferase [Geodermatophilus sabuli]MBB3083608.1 glycosyltransferase involved in cell wall biosynthesis [Geodermatophilus sabuli]SNX96671.1 Glycosyltransferase involved in cell wall bisynthesis [Geodermatophilus sabuli]
MKVLVVIDSLNFGGAENVLVTLASEAPRLGLELEVLSLAPPTGGRATWLPRLEAAGLPVRFLGLTRLLQPSGVPQLARAIRDSGCDVVHAHLEDASTLAPIAGRMARRPVLCTLHHVPGSLAGREAVRERLAVAVGSRSAGLIFVSQASYDAFAARYPRSHVPERWSVVHNGVDLQRFRPLPPGSTAQLPPEFGIPAGVPVAALVGHMRPGKGQEEAVRAWPDVVSACPDARLLLIGNGPLEERLRGLARDLGVASHVVFAGARDDVQELLPRVTVVVQPTHSEALPTALLEASACGVPAVATAVGGVPEVVVDGETGWLFASPAPDLVAASVKEALGDPVERERRGAAARARVEAVFSSADWAEALATRYAAVAGGRAVTQL